MDNLIDDANRNDRILADKITNTVAMISFLKQIKGTISATTGRRRNWCSKNWKVCPNRSRRDSTRLLLFWWISVIKHVSSFINCKTRNPLLYSTAAIVVVVTRKGRSSKNVQVFGWKTNLTATQSFPRHFKEIPNAAPFDRTEITCSIICSTG